MAIHMGPARFRFYFDGRSHTLTCRYCVTQIVPFPSAGEAHKGRWSVIGVFDSPESSPLSLDAFKAAFAEKPNMEGIFRTDADAGNITISGLVTVASSTPTSANEPASLRLVLRGRNAPRTATHTTPRAPVSDLTDLCFGVKSRLRS